MSQTTEYCLLPFFTKSPWMGGEVYQQLDWPVVLSQQLPSCSVFLWWRVHAFQLFLIVVFFTCHFFPHWSDKYSAPLSPYRHSPLLFFALFNYQTCRWPHHVNTFIITKNIRLILESQLLAPIQCHNKRCPQECACGKAKGWPHLFKWLKLLYTTGICWVLYMPWSQFLSM